MPILKSKNIHFLEVIRPARLRVVAGEALEVLAYEGSCDWDFEQTHIAPAISDPHVHFRESYSPSQQEWEEYWELDFIKNDYKETLQKIVLEKQNYSVKNGILASLKGGVWFVGAMSNTTFPAITEKIWKKTIQQYQNTLLVGRKNPLYFHLWHYAHPKAEKIMGQCAKDFGSTFGAGGFSKQERENIYKKHQNCDIRFHNDRARKESITQFLKKQTTNPEALLHDWYYSGDLVLQEQQEVYNLAKKYQLATLIPLHIPTGSALEQALRFQKENILNIELEIGLDYLVNHWEQKKNDPTRWYNYRRPAHSSKQEQIFLIELLKKNTHNLNLWIGSDHAPHTKKTKKWKNKLPSVPGTRCIEFFGSILQELVNNWGFSYLEIDKIASYNPAKHLQKYRQKYASFPYPVGAIQSGNMANLRVFNPHLKPKVSEQTMAKQLQDNEYHSSLCQRDDLKGKNLMTIVNGVCFDTREEPKIII